MSTYTGHVGEGGLQGHSIGGFYPYIVYGQETAEGTRYGVQNGATGTDSGALYTCAEAYQLAIDAKALDVAAAARGYAERPHADNASAYGCDKRPESFADLLTREMTRFYAVPSADLGKGR